MQKLLRRMVAIFRHRPLEAELAEEMEFHRSMMADQSAGAQGTRGPQFGNATLARDDARAVWLPPSLESVWQDVAYAVRMLWREPAFALLAIGALTAGIGLNSGLFAAYTALAMKPWIAGLLGAIALGFACIGMFGVFAYWVRQRTQEIGVRMALGAQSSDVIHLVLGTTARAVGIGLAAGLVMSIAASSLLRAFLFGLSAIDAVTYVGVSFVLVAASLLAALIPARRATQIDPLVALRYE